MSGRRQLLLGCTLLVLGLAGCATTCCQEDGEQRAGYPSHVSRLAQPSATGPYDGYYVGGGSACRGDGPGNEDGTWGWDYFGRCWKSKVALLWSDGKYQGGAGAYQMDGPHLLNHEKAEE